MTPTTKKQKQISNYDERSNGLSLSSSNKPNMRMKKTKYIQASIIMALIDMFGII